MRTTAETLENSHLKSIMNTEHMTVVKRSKDDC